MTPEERVTQVEEAIKALCAKYGCELQTVGTSEWLKTNDGGLMVQNKFSVKAVALPNWSPADEPLPLWNDYINSLGATDGD